MTQEDQQDIFQEELEKLIARFISDFDLTVASAVGVMDMVKFRMHMDNEYERDFEIEDDDYESE